MRKKEIIIWKGKKYKKSNRRHENCDLILTPDDAYNKLYGKFCRANLQGYVLVNKSKKCKHKFHLQSQSLKLVQCEWNEFNGGVGFNPNILMKFYVCNKCRKEKIKEVKYDI